MTEFRPVSLISEFRLLDEGDVLEGYLDGVSGSETPGSDRSRSYCHGWRNGRVDAGFAEQDTAQKALAAAFDEMGRTTISTYWS